MKNIDESKLIKKELLGRIFAGSLLVIAFYFLFLEIAIRDKLNKGVSFPLDFILVFFLFIIYPTLILIVWAWKIIKYIYQLIMSD